MSLSIGPHHKIWTMARIGRETSFATAGYIRGHHEQGYALVALLAVMAVIAIFAMAAAPSIRQQALREREREAIFRGEQIAEAIRVYYSHQVRISQEGPQSLPRSMEQLLEGAQTGRTKKLQVLRASAARDPLSDSGEWRLIRLGGMETSDFAREVSLYTENIPPKTSDRQLEALARVMVQAIIPGASGSASGRDDNYSGPFIGVASRSKNNSVIYYYGIARHDGWIFTPIFR